MMKEYFQNRPEIKSSEMLLIRNSPPVKRFFTMRYLCRGARNGNLCRLLGLLCYVTKDVSLRMETIIPPKVRNRSFLLSTLSTSVPKHLLHAEVVLPEWAWLTSLIGWFHEETSGHFNNHHFKGGGGFVTEDSEELLNSCFKTFIWYVNTVVSWEQPVLSSAE